MKKTDIREDKKSWIRFSVFDDVHASPYQKGPDLWIGSLLRLLIILFTQ